MNEYLQDSTGQALVAASDRYERRDRFLIIDHFDITHFPRFLVRSNFFSSLHFTEALKTSLLNKRVNICVKKCHQEKTAKKNELIAETRVLPRPNRSIAWMT